MSQMDDGNNRSSDGESKEDLERLLTEGVTLNENAVVIRDRAASKPSFLTGDNDDDEEASQGRDVQGSLGLFAEAAQDMATAAVELGLGRHFACVDFCNQAVEKAAQAVSLLRFGRRSAYDHDLEALGRTVRAPTNIQALMATLTPFHPEAFYVNTPPEEADEVISAEQASGYVQNARTVLRWARNIVLNP